MSTTTNTENTASAAATATAEEGKRLGGVAAEEAMNVATEASKHVRGLLGEAQAQLSDQTGTQRDRLVETLHSLTDDLERLAGQSETSGIGSDLARQASQRARAFTQGIEGREPADLLDDVRAFARRRPGTFLLGALAAGVVAGRLARGARSEAGSTGAAASSAPVASPVVPSTAPIAPGYQAGRNEAQLDDGIATAMHPAVVTTDEQSGRP